MKLYLVERARLFRKQPTPAEAILWNHLRNRKLSGYKIRRQHIISNKYIADFYCDDKKLLIEIDGTIHDLDEVKSNDQIRENNLKMWGYKIVRFTNEEILSNIKNVLDSLLNELNK